MHPTLAAALANPRFAAPYGSDPEDNGSERLIATDSYMKRRATRYSERHRSEFPESDDQDAPTKH